MSARHFGETKMKTISKLLRLFLCITICALAVTAQAQSTWKLSKDLLANSNQISFNQGSNGVWYLMQSNSLAHLAKAYSLLPFYSLPCVTNPSAHLVVNIPCWQNPSPDTEGNVEPIIAANVTYRTLFFRNFGIPARSVTMHPTMSGLAVIGWKSPFTGLVNAAGFFSDLDPNCGNGVVWSVDIWSANNGSQSLASGTIANGGAAQSFSLTGISIKTGQLLYFTVDPNGDYHCDTTGVDVTINQVR
jgi:hypothetical protein